MQDKQERKMLINGLTIEKQKNNNTQTIPEEEKLKWPKKIQKDFQSHY